MWVAESGNLPGLVTEAETVERLFEKLRVMVPEDKPVQRIYRRYGQLDNDYDRRRRNAKGHLRRA